MYKGSRIASTRLSLFKVLRFSTARSALIFCLLGCPLGLVFAQTRGNIDPTQTLDWVAGAVSHAQQMRVYKDADKGLQPSAVIPEFGVDPDPSGQIATFQPEGSTAQGNNAFFQDLGTNGRTCFTCHQPQTGWTISAASAKARFDASSGADPLFRLVDGATCPTADVSNPAAKRQAYKLLLEKGLIRIGLPLPKKNLQFEVDLDKIVDPYNCTTSKATGLQNKQSGIMSMYRRPLPSTNLGFLTAIMWDGREPSLAQQSVDATLIHAQADPKNPPTADQQGQIVAFETGIFTAQVFDNEAGDLTAGNATGGPVALSQEIANFFVGVNDPVGLNPKGLPFDPNIFDLYLLPMSNHLRSINRGEQIFNGTQINITGVTGLNDVLNLSTIPGFCGTCHDTPNVGNHSVKAPLNIGISNAGANKPPALDISGLPVFTLRCTSGPLAGQVFVVTDPGRAMITGNCADIGKVKGPILRGLAARAPYFHNGSAATLMDVVNFYDERFAIGFTSDQKQDLVDFLNAL
jgi:cytochrome c peroxidase